MVDKLFLALKRQGSDRPYLYIDLKKVIAFEVMDSVKGINFIFSDSKIPVDNIIPEHCNITYYQLAEILSKIIIDSYNNSLTTYKSREFNDDINKFCKNAGVSTTVFEYDSGIVKIIL